MFWHLCHFLFRREWMQSYHWACHDYYFFCHCQESKQIREHRNMLQPIASKLNLVTRPVRSGKQSRIGDAEGWPLVNQSRQSPTNAIALFWFLFWTWAGRWHLYSSSSPTKKPTFCHWTAVYNKLGPSARACKGHSPAIHDVRSRKCHMKTASRQSPPHNLLCTNWRATGQSQVGLPHNNFSLGLHVPSVHPSMILWFGPVDAFWCQNGAPAVYRSKLGAVIVAYQESSNKTGRLHTVYNLVLKKVFL